MTEANLDGNMYYYPLRSHDEDGEPLVPSTPTNQSPHSSFRVKGQRGAGGFLIMVIVVLVVLLMMMMVMVMMIKW